MRRRLPQHRQSPRAARCRKFRRRDRSELLPSLHRRQVVPITVFASRQARNMIVSMTGFGDATAENDGTHYAVEIRSLNNRYLQADHQAARQRQRPGAGDRDDPARAARPRVDHLHPEDAHGPRRGGVSHQYAGAEVISRAASEREGPGPAGARSTWRAWCNCPASARSRAMRPTRSTRHGDDRFAS